MRRVALSMIVLAALAGLAVAPVPADEPRTLEGGFVWSQGPTGDLKAVFKPTGEGQWDVDFHFNFRGEDHTYSGTAQGKLAEGSLSGSVQNENKKRTFKFQGEFKDGEFQGTHSEVKGDGSVDTGTLMLKG